MKRAWRSLGKWAIYGASLLHSTIWVCYVWYRANLSMRAGCVKKAWHCGGRWAIKEEVLIPLPSSGVWHSLRTSINRQPPVTKRAWHCAKNQEKKKVLLRLWRDWQGYARDRVRREEPQRFSRQQKRCMSPPVLPYRPLIVPSMSAS